MMPNFGYSRTSRRNHSRVRYRILIGSKTVRKVGRDIWRIAVAKMVQGLATHGRRSLSSILCLAAGLAVIPAETTRAGALCADMNALVREAHSNFSNWTAKTTEAEPPLMLRGATDCAMARLLSGTRIYHCTWVFAYRAAGAYGTFDGFDQTFQDCFRGRAKRIRDQSVNHPDFYDLLQYQLGQVNVTLSIKDKSALQSTYVFVRVHGANSD